jgi:cytidylate kinase
MGARAITARARARDREDGRGRARDRTNGALVPRAVARPDARRDDLRVQPVRGPGRITPASNAGRSFALAFAKHVGADWKDQLTRAFTDKPVVVIAGQQCTGKSTAAASLAQRLGTEKSGTGALVRQAAAERGLPVEKFVATIDEQLDVSLDFRAAQVIGSGSAGTFESRLAGHLAQLVRSLGKKNVVSVYLVASTRTQALRWVRREVNGPAADRIDARLTVAKSASLEDVLRAIVALGDREVNAKLAPLVDGIGERDAVDRERLLALYGVDYQDASAFDVVISTDGKSQEQVQDEISRALAQRAPGVFG